MEKSIELIEKRIQDRKNEIESFYMNDTDFVNAKRIKELHALNRECEQIIELLKSSI